MSQSVKSKLTRRKFCRAAAVISSLGALGRFGALAQTPPALINSTGPDSLRSHAAARGLLYGAAVNPALLDVDGAAADKTADPYTLLFAAQANILVAENSMKWGALRPAPDKFDFTQGDRLVRFAGLNGQRVRGHNLCWHEGNPGWLKTTANKENARQLLTEHIQTVAGHFRGQLHSWDVVNEAINPPDGLADGLRKTMWLDLIGPDYLELAFRTAAAADPQAKLTYNDYDIELDTPKQTAKRDAVMALLRRFKAKGVPIHAVGVQSHLDATAPPAGKGLQDFIREAAKMGLEVFVTEMDVNTHAVVGDAEAQDAAVAAVFRDYLRLVLAEPNVPIALTWGLDDAHSWLSQVHGSQSHRPDGTRERPLPFDDDLKPTPAFLAMRDAIDASRPDSGKNAKP
ncbi:MAG: endo-1,4-beta-xylanase [Terracidiphilus sp.]